MSEDKENSSSEIKNSARKKTNWKLLLTGTVLFLIGFWFGMAQVDYVAGKTVFAYRTAGWYVFGFMFVVLFSAGLAAIFCVIARWSLITAWILMIIVSSYFTVYSIIDNSPKQRLKYLIGDKAAQKLPLQMLKTGDSFCDGGYAWGILGANEQSLALLKEDISLREVYYEPSMGVPLDISQYFKDLKKTPLKSGKIFRDAHCVYFIPNGGNKIYFYRRIP